MLSLGKLLDPSEFDKYIEETNSFETVLHKYGTKMVVPSYPCWMEYRDEKGIAGSIGFTRNTIKNNVLYEMCEKVAKIIDNITIDEFKPDPNRVHFIKTLGSILPHRDESSRMCCINIGVKNSNSAITKIAHQNTNVNNNSTNYIIEDGFGFLVNTYNYHAVTGDRHTPRYLITYGFGHEFDDVKRIFK
jgi:hypothetical protein